MPPQLDKVKVLLVEDHFFMRNIWRTMLSGMGVREIVEASTVTDAFIALETDKFDMAIVDYHLGKDGTGADFIRRLRAMEGKPAQFLPVIGCTADTRRAVINDFVTAGADELVAKPVSAASAYSRIFAVIERRRAFVRTKAFFGPDRRRKMISFEGEERRDQ